MKARQNQNEAKSLSHFKYQPIRFYTQKSVRRSIIRDTAILRDKLHSVIAGNSWASRGLSTGRACEVGTMTESDIPRTDQKNSCYHIHCPDVHFDRHKCFCETDLHEKCKILKPFRLANFTTLQCLLVCRQSGNMTFCCFELEDGLYRRIQTCRQGSLSQ